MRPGAHVGSSLVGWPLQPELVSALAAGGDDLVVHYQVKAVGCLHADEDGTGSVSPGGTVGRLDDLSGNAHHAGQATSGARPLLSDTGGPGGDALELVFSTGAGAKWLFSDDVTTPGDGTLVVVGAATGVGGLVAHHSTEGGGFKGDYFYNPNEAMGYRGNYPNASTGDLPFTPTSGTYYVWAVVVVPGEADTKSNYVDGVFVASADSDVGADPLVGPMVLGALNASGEYPGNVKILEVRRYNRALSAGEIATLSTELATEHNL